MDQETIKCLIDLIVGGDKTSFRKLVEAHQSFIYATAFRMLCDRYDSEEIVQETFIRVWKNLHRFNPEMQFSTWLYKIAVNLCYDKIKANKRHRDRISFDLEKSIIINQPSLENIETSVINKEYADIIGYLCNELPPKQRLVFTLSELDERSVEEISEITGLTSQKIKSNLYCARQNLKNKLIEIEVRSEQHAKE
jgi:RNA polymerase sigma-70 factor (ECF subfamily)